MLITFQEPRMKTTAVKSARMPEMRMNGCQLSKFAACIIITRRIMRNTRRRRTMIFTC